MVGWLIKFYEIMTPLYELMKQEIKSCRWVHSDDTSVPVKITRKKGKAHKGYFWVYIGENTNTIFEYTHSRKGKNPQDFLEGYKGYLHADAYSGYDKLFKNGDIKECACWSHGRRKFFDAYDAGDKRALRVLELCGKLFLVEKYMKENRYRYAQIKEVRNDLSKRITGKIKKWIDDHEFEVLPGDDLGKAMKYMCNHWPAFLTFMQEGYLSLENNLSERQIRKVVLGRQNWIICGSEDGAKRSALIYSIMGTCKLLEINPTEYLNDILEKILVPGVNLAELTPIEWKKRNTPSK